MVLTIKHNNVMPILKSSIFGTPLPLLQLHHYLGVTVLVDGSQELCQEDHHIAQMVNPLRPETEMSLMNLKKINEN